MTFRSNRGAFINGFNVGILTLRTKHLLEPGNVQHAGSFGFPVIYEPIDLEDPLPLMRGEPWLREKVIKGAQRLAALNVSVIAGACGSFAYYQRAVAEAVAVPVFLSIMLQVPLILNGLGKHQKLCIICGDLGSMNERVFEECAITDLSNIVFKPLSQLAQFQRLIAGDSSLCLDEFEANVVDIARKAVGEAPSIGAFLLQCSDTPPFGSAIQKATGRPVFDMTLMIRWLESAAHYPIYDMENRIRRGFHRDQMEEAPHATAGSRQYER